MLWFREVLVRDSFKNRNSYHFYTSLMWARIRTRTVRKYSLPQYARESYERELVSSYNDFV